MVKSWIFFFLCRRGLEKLRAHLRPALVQEEAFQGLRVGEHAARLRHRDRPGGSAPPPASEVTESFCQKPSCSSTKSEKKKKSKSDDSERGRGWRAWQGRLRGGGRRHGGRRAAAGDLPPRDPQVQVHGHPSSQQTTPQQRSSTASKTTTGVAGNLIQNVPNAWFVAWVLPRGTRSPLGHDSG